MVSAILKPSLRSFFAKVFLYEHYINVCAIGVQLEYVWFDPQAKNLQSLDLIGKYQT